MVVFRVMNLVLLLHFSQQQENNSRDVCEDWDYHNLPFDLETYTSDYFFNDCHLFAIIYNNATGMKYVEHIAGAKMELQEQKCANDPTVSSRCSCDPECAKFADCCPDSIYFKPEEQKLGASSATCYNFFETFFYVFTRCPPEWNNSEIRHQCEHPDPSYPNPMRDSLITSLRTNYTYRNSYCASCHDDLHQDMMYIWPLLIEWFFFPNILQNFDPSESFKRMVYDKNSSNWYLDLSGFEVRHIPCVPCKVSLFAEDDGYSYRVDCPSPAPAYLPIGARALCRIEPEESYAMLEEERIRYCEDDISECAEDWNDKDERDQCEAYTARVSQCRGDTWYRNFHCALCNYQDREPNFCPMLHVEYFPVPFALLLDWRNVEECSDGEVFDPLSNQCTNTALYHGEVLSQNSSCTNVSFSKGQYVLQEETNTVFVEELNNTYYQHEYVIEDDRLILCLTAKPFRSSDPQLGYITIVGLSLSITCIVLHLAVLCLVPKLLNLPALNLASLCVSLLLLYSSFIASGFMTPGTTSCVVVAVTVHYSLLASFLWMLIISFDIFNMTRLTKAELVASKGMKLRRFAVYSAGGWLIPALIAGSAELLDHVVPDSSFAPRYGEGRCWFSHSNALLLFCLAPLIFVMSLNVVFFLWSSFLIRQMTVSTHTSDTRRNFSLHLRLCIIMGLTWITGILSAAVDIQGLWYLFVVFNTMQGVFIFIGFTCTKNIRRELQNSLRARFALKTNTGFTGISRHKNSNKST